VLSEEELEELKSKKFDRAKEWEDAVKKWYIGYMDAIIHNVRQHVRDASIGPVIQDACDVYKQANPYPKLEDYI